ncbi:hypothetical protein [Chitinasiproducens palmae]|uniref:hypothetical protein n=1 Tax=Chitinasiproducens palmae TaxID=1770053 RepID=UPI00147F91CE|nr:hypothetical protein [Chitinasiproducens palmae]
MFLPSPVAARDVQQKFGEHSTEDIQQGLCLRDPLSSLARVCGAPQQRLCSHTRQARAGAFRDGVPMVSVCAGESCRAARGAARSPVS